MSTTTHLIHNLQTILNITDRGINRDSRSNMAECALENSNARNRSSNPDDTGCRTILWCVPRSCSTALTKCLSFAEGAEVWFEPFTYCKVTAVTTKGHLGLDLPPTYEGNEETYRRAGDLVDQICHCKVRPEYLSFASISKFLERSSGPNVFVKDMAYMMTPETYKFFPEGFKHTFMIRYPLRVFRSFRKASFGQFSALGLLTGDAASEDKYDIGCDNPYMTSGGLLFKDIYDIWKYVRENIDSNPIVIDGDDLLTNPTEVLSKYCRAIGLPYDESLLKWDASADVTTKWKFPADGLVESLVHFYQTALTSSEFLPASKIPSCDQLTPDVTRCADEMMKYYEEMYETRLQ